MSQSLVDGGNDLFEEIDVERYLKIEERLHRFPHPARVPPAEELHAKRLRRRIQLIMN